MEHHGWPTVDVVGEDGASAAWLLVQHADRDPEFQQRCLDLLAELPAGQASAQDIAYLTDRVRLAQGAKQIYGTQVTSVDGELQPRPIEDDDNVDQRRAAVDLPPLAEYLEEIKRVMSPPQEAPQPHDRNAFNS